MKSNVLFKFLIPPILLAVLLIVFVFQPKKPKDTSHVADGLALTQEEARELGIEGDTPADTLRTLVGELRHMRTQINNANERNERLTEHNKELESRSREWERQLETALERASTESEKAKAETQRLVDRMMNMMGELEGKVSSASSGFGDMPIGLGLDANQDGASAGEVVWIEPSDGIEVDRNGRPTGSGFNFATDFKNPLDGSIVDKQQKEALNTLGQRGSSSGSVDRNTDVEPVYTIAENSTLMGSTTMTALIGRVPVDGTVNDPYPFKVLIGKDNLVANGFELPEVTGAVMSGTAQGDWTLSCVRGQVETMTFIFEDGTVRTVPEPEKVVRNRSASSSSTRNTITGGIGYISDQYGIPCIAGDRKSNAKEYITNNSLITAAGAGIALAFGDDDTATVSNGTTTLQTNQAFNQILTRGVGDVQDWINKLYGQAFAAVYVPPHQQVAVHIDRELTIDFEKFGRKVRHNEQSNEIVWLD